MEAAFKETSNRLDRDISGRGKRFEAGSQRQPTLTGAERHFCEAIEQMGWDAKMANRLALFDRNFPLKSDSYYDFIAKGKRVILATLNRGSDKECLILSVTINDKSLEIKCTSKIPTSTLKRDKQLKEVNDALRDNFPDMSFGIERKIEGGIATSCLDAILYKSEAGSC